MPLPLTDAVAPPMRPVRDLSRRSLLQGSAVAGGLGALGLAGCATVPSMVVPERQRPALAPIRALADRLFDLTVCLRPFRAAGPRLDTEQIGDTLVVHNYGHGGSGWSLSWGSSTLAVRKAMATGPKAVAVIGCGALGITSALLAQRAGARVTIYARELLPETRSIRATGSWTPDSRIALTDKGGPGFAALWEEMARTSFKAYRGYLGLPGEPVLWRDHYTVSDDPPDGQGDPPPPGALDFASYRPLIRDLTPRPQRLSPEAAPFDAPYVYRSEMLMFNLADYAHTLLSDFRLAGGEVRRAEFHSPAELATLPEKVVINCPGYGARALWRDESVVPVRGQIGWLIPQPEVTYGLYYKTVSTVPRSDGMVVQALEGGDMKGYGETSEAPDRGESERAVSVLAELMGRMRPRRP